MPLAKQMLALRTVVLVLVVSAFTANCRDAINLELISLSTSESTVDAGQTVTIRWEIRGARAVGLWQSPGGEVITEAPGLGEARSQPIRANTTFTVTGTSATGRAISGTLNVRVQNLEITSFIASPSIIQQGQTATLTWVSRGPIPSDIRLVDSRGVDINFSSQGRQGTATVQPNTTETYQLTLRDGDRQVQAEVIVAVTTSEPPTEDSFEVLALVNGVEMPVSAVILGSTVRLEWGIVDAEEVQLSINNAVVIPWTSSQAPRGSATTTVDINPTDFVLETRSQAAPNPVRFERTISAQMTPIIDSLSVTPSEYTQSSATALVQWLTRGADSIQLSANLVPVSTPLSPNGEFQTDVTRETEFLLSVTNSFGTTQASTRILASYNDSEPNDTPPEALAISTDGSSVRGNISSSADTDVYRFTMPGERGVFATIEPEPGRTCAQLLPTLELLDGQGQVLGSGREPDVATTVCSEILPPQLAPFADNLPAGPYFLRISQNDAASDGRYMISARTLIPTPELQGLTRETVGQPSWAVSDFVQLASPVGIGSFGPLERTLQTLLAPRHDIVQSTNVTTWFGRPSLASLTRFEEELRTLVTARNLASRSEFTAAELSPPAGLVLGYTVVPTDDTITGLSRDIPMSPGGRVIPNEILPIQINLSYIINTSEFPVLGTFEITEDSGTDGLSHMNVLQVFSETFVNLGENIDNLVWQITIRDQNDDGYNIRVPATVTN